jgi:hypothetical protein
MCCGIHASCSSPCVQERGLFLLVSMLAVPGTDEITERLPLHCVGPASTQPSVADPTLTLQPALPLPWATITTGAPEENTFWSPPRYPPARSVAISAAAAAAVAEAQEAAAAAAAGIRTAAAAGFVSSAGSTTGLCGPATMANPVPAMQEQPGSTGIHNEGHEIQHGAGSGGVPGGATAQQAERAQRRRQLEQLLRNMTPQQISERLARLDPQQLSELKFRCNRAKQRRKQQQQQQQQAAAAAIPGEVAGLAAGAQTGC